MDYGAARRRRDVTGGGGSGLRRCKSKLGGCNMQKELFSDAPPSSPIDGMRLKLERKIDLQKPCCSNVAIVRAGKGPHASELRCAKCDSHRSWLPKEAANRLLTVLAFWPEAKIDVHVLRGSKT
jgi:hypothetical protein